MYDRITTRDLGIAIRDSIEGKTFLCFIELDGKPVEKTGPCSIIDHVDIGDPSNVSVCLSNGQIFTVRISEDEMQENEETPQWHAISPTR